MQHIFLNPILILIQIIFISITKHTYLMLVFLDFLDNLWMPLCPLPAEKESSLRIIVFKHFQNIVNFHVTPTDVKGKCYMLFVSVPFTNNRFVTPVENM